MSAVSTPTRVIRCTAALQLGRLRCDSFPRYLEDSYLEDDRADRRHLHRFTTPRRGHGNRLIWLLDELEAGL